MSNAIETSLRRALAKGDADDPDFRLQIYEAAERALLRLEGDEAVDPAGTDGRREQLIAAIEAIERDHLPRSSSSPEASDGEEQAVAGEAAADEANAAEPAARPFAGTDGSDEAEAAEVDATPGADESADAPGRAERPQDESSPGQPGSTQTPDKISADRPASPRASRLKRWMRKDPESPRDGIVNRVVVPAVILLLLVFLLAVGGWLLMPFFTSGTPGAPERAAAPAEPKMSIEDAIRSADTGGTQGVAGSPAWTEVFSGAGAVDAAAVAGTVEAAEAGGEPAARIPASDTGADGARETVFVIPADIARRFAGRKATGELTVASPDEASRTFTVRCLFGGETVCGRQRFTASSTEEPFLIQMDMPASIEEPGQIAIDPSIGTGAKDLLVMGFRLRPAE
ncbi:hypothetical protein [Aurantimonas sp. VKM B-3413]|uniref:hypothetical protein n=1 Tax=Aurantimonas sp. VKM B-3413 TaxID=2779401 RepID=UPI001E3AB071|nr:hypothetical protein [Aurantimonas sp. VKM B-3413]MCB8838043.1 hypothetical protein [Aurantimonas sp. VKM B-3413]